MGRPYYKAGVPGKIGVEFDPDLDGLVRMNLDRLVKKGLCMVEIKPVADPLTKRQRNWIHGECAAIAHQLNQGTGSAYTVEDVKIAMKRMAMTERDYPATLAPDGTMQPISLAQATKEQAGAVIDTILDFAYANELYLVEYDADGKPIRTVQGTDIRNLGGGHGDAA